MPSHSLPDFRQNHLRRPSLRPKLLQHLLHALRPISICLLLRPQPKRRPLAGFTAVTLTNVADNAQNASYPVKNGSGMKSAFITGGAGDATSKVAGKITPAKMLVCVIGASNTLALGPVVKRNSASQSDKDSNRNWNGGGRRKG